MAVTLTGLVGPGRGTPNDARPLSLTEELAVRTQMGHAKYYDLTKQGRVFSQTVTPLGLAIPIYTATAIAGAIPIWNPPASGVEVELLFTDINYGSGTADYGSVGLMARKLDAIATGAIMTAMASTTPIGGKLFAGNTSKTLSSNAGTCTVTAGVAGDFVRSMASINLEAQTGTAHGTLVVHYDFEGSVIVPPGVLVYLAATKASVALYATTMVWAENPL